MRGLQEDSERRRRSCEARWSGSEGRGRDGGPGAGPGQTASGSRSQESLTSLRLGRAARWSEGCFQELQGYLSHPERLRETLGCSVEEGRGSGGCSVGGLLRALPWRASAGTLEWVRAAPLCFAAHLRTTRWFLDHSGAAPRSEGCCLHLSSEGRRGHHS